MNPIAGILARLMLALEYHRLDYFVRGGAHHRGHSPNRRLVANERDAAGAVHPTLGAGWTQFSMCFNHLLSPNTRCVDAAILCCQGVESLCCSRDRPILETRRFDDCDLNAAASPGLHDN